MREVLVNLGDSGLLQLKKSELLKIFFALVKLYYLSAFISKTTRAYIGKIEK